MDFQNFDMSTLLGYVIGAVFIVLGFMQLVTRKVVSRSTEYEKYTEESMKKYAVLSGIEYIVIGLVFIATRITMSMSLLETMPILIAELVVVVVLIVAIILTRKFVLVKKDGR